jgi:hypothetical protein
VSEKPSGGSSARTEVQEGCGGEDSHQAEEGNTLKGLEAPRELRARNGLNHRREVADARVEQCFEAAVVHGGMLPKVQTRGDVTYANAIGASRAQERETGTEKTA